MYVCVCEGGRSVSQTPTISKDDLERFRPSELLVDHSAIDFTSLFKAEQVAKASNELKDLRRITSSAYMKSSENREI